MGFFECGRTRSHFMKRPVEVPSYSDQGTVREPIPPRLRDRPVMPRKASRAQAATAPGVATPFNARCAWPSRRSRESPMVSDSLSILVALAVTRPASRLISSIRHSRVIASVIFSCAVSTSLGDRVRHPGSSSRGGLGCQGHRPIVRRPAGALPGREGLLAAKLEVHAGVRGGVAGPGGCARPPCTTAVVESDRVAGEAEDR